MDPLQLLRFAIVDAVSGRGRRSIVASLEGHLAATMGWLCRAQDAYPPGGVSIEYSLRNGWGSGYPETTGYIIPTFVEYARRFKNGEYLERAVRMADWELLIQEPDGSFKGGPWGSGRGSFVFDTGQILFGLLAAHKLTGNDEYLSGAMRASNWLVGVQDSAGMWSRHTYNDIPHVYYTRVAWGLAEVGFYTDNRKFIDAANRNCEWALSQQLENGWFDQAGFTKAGHGAPFTHTIAYTIEGLLETGNRLARSEFVDAAQRAAVALLGVCRDGYYRGTYDRDWRSQAGYSCLTGNAQIAMLFFRLHALRSDKRFVTAAQATNRFLRRCQYVEGAPRIAGAISGSYPIWGKYQRFSFPNWAAKFFADALMLEMDAGTSCDSE